MPQVRIAFGATHFRTRHAISRILVLDNLALIRRAVEARPARPGVELRCRVKKRLTAAHAVIHSGILRLPVLTRKSALSPCLPCYVILLRRKLLFPLRLALCSFLCHGLLYHRKNLTLIITDLICELW